MLCANSASSRAISAVATKYSFTSDVICNNSSNAILEFGIFLSVSARLFTAAPMLSSAPFPFPEMATDAVKTTAKWDSRNKVDVLHIHVLVDCFITLQNQSVNGRMKFLHKVQALREPIWLLDRDSLNHIS